MPSKYHYHFKNHSYILINLLEKYIFLYFLAVQQEQGKLFMTWTPT